MDWKAGAVRGWIRSYTALTNLGVFAVAGTIIGFWYSIGDRAADRTGACLFRADVAGAKFSDDVDRNMLKEACILKQDGQQQRNELNTTSQNLAEFSKQIPNCDGPYRCQNDLWDCLSPNDRPSSESPTGLNVP